MKISDGIYLYLVCLYAKGTKVVLHSVEPWEDWSNGDCPCSREYRSGIKVYYTYQTKRMKNPKAHVVVLGSEEVIAMVVERVNDELGFES